MGDLAQIRGLVCLEVVAAYHRDALRCDVAFCHICEPLRASMLWVIILLDLDLDQHIN